MKVGFQEKVPVADEIFVAIAAPTEISPRRVREI
jgi:hypothetical protein